MGARGPRKKDAKLDRLEGNPSKRERKTREMSAPIGAPSAPAWLHRDAKAEWRRIMPDLLKTGAISRIDRSALALYCQAYARWKESEEKVSEIVKDLLGTTRHGEQVLHPYVKNRYKCWEQLKSSLEKLGLSPKDRATIDLPLLNIVQTAKEGDEMENLCD